MSYIALTSTGKLSGIEIEDKDFEDESFMDKVRNIFG